MASEHQSVGCNTLRNADIWYVRPRSEEERYYLCSLKMTQSGLEMAGNRWNQWISPITSIQQLGSSYSRDLGLEPQVIDRSRFPADSRRIPLFQNYFEKFT